MPKGKKVASSIVRKHRLIEMFLVDVMNFGWEEVHDIAEEMEHVQSEKFFDRMNEMLNHPTVDPHGSAIPDKTENLERQEYIKLSEIREPKTVKIGAVKESPKEFLLFLNKRNIKLGTVLNIKQIEDFDNSILVDYENQLKKGDNLVFASFGGGFTWGAIYLKWAYNSN